MDNAAFGFRVLVLSCACLVAVSNISSLLDIALSGAQMDGSSLSLQFPVTPRLRVSRQTYPNQFLSATRPSLDDGTDDTDDHADDDDDNASTPRVGTLTVVSEDLDVARSASATPVVEDNPASRLRALLARVPRDDTPVATHFLHDPPSMHDSDMVIDSTQFSPQLKSTPASNASASLRNLFSRALREGEESPARPQRRRRSSLESSGLENSPVKSRNRSKRLSLSDDELEKANRSTGAEATSERSFLSSQAATLDALRQRLSGPTLDSILRDTPEDRMNELSRAETNNVSSPHTPPIATSTPLRQSVSQFPSQLAGSNLMHDDSEMQRYMKNVESDVQTEDEHGIEDISKTPFAGPSTQRTRAKSPLPRERPLSRHGSSESHLHNHSRPSSRLSASDGHHDDVNPKKERMHDLERGWNRPLSAYMNRLDISSHDLSPGRPVLRRHGSSASLASSEDLDHSIKSQGNQGDDIRYRHSLGHSSHGSLDSSRSRSSSISPIHLRGSERTRTISQPSPPPNTLRTRARADSTTARERPTSSLAYSRPSFSAHNQRRHDRAVSPASSVASQDSDREIRQEFQHVRERNWNSPHPKWNLSDEQAKLARRRSHVVSPLPSPTRQRHGSVTHHNDHQPAEKTVNPAETILTHNTSTANSLSVPTIKRSPSNSSLAVQSSGIPRARPQSPLPPSRIERKSEIPQSSPPSHGDRLNNTPRRAPSSPSHAIKTQTAGGAFHSHIPRKAREHTQPHTNVLKRAGIAEHREEKAERGSLPTERSPKISMSVEPLQMHDSDFESFHEEDILASSTKPRISAGVEESSTKAIVTDEESLSLNDIPGTPNKSHMPVLPANFSPPSSPPSEQIVTTPKRRGSLSSSKPDFKSPSPPKGLPELPDPPSSEETDSDRTPPPRTPALSNRYVDAKTPRPPGGWATPFATPAPPERNVPAPAKSDLGTFQTELYTPPASLSKATSFLLKTPAPPGAWLPTPANSKKLQKVRFDKEDSSNGQIIKVASPDQSYQSSSVNDGARIEEKSSDILGTERRELSSPRNPRRISTIRIVDAFGKQIVDTPDGQQSHADTGNELQNANHEKSDSSVGITTRIRVVDAMGTPVEEPKDVDTAVESSAQENLSSFIEDLEEKKLERKQALELLQKTIADLKNDFTRTDIETETTDPAGARAADLLARSQQAKDERERLRRQISSATTYEQISSIKKARVTPRLLFRWNGIAFWVAAIVTQLLILLALCRWSSLRARRLFLTTYMDPFYPELHLHITNPELLRMASSSSGNFSNHDTHKNSGWMQSIEILWHHLFDSLGALPNILWEASTDPPRTITWPPT